MPKIACPYCGKATTVPIVYGYPDVAAFEAEQRGELVLGGCCRDGSERLRFCRSCGKRFDRPDFPQVPLRSLSFCIGGFMSQGHELDVRPNHAESPEWIVRYRFLDESGSLAAEQSIELVEPIKILNAAEWERYCRRLRSCYIADWEKEYRNWNILDGTNWFLEIAALTGEVFSSSGSNDGPAAFNRVLRILGGIAGKNIG